ncbi:MAG: hypothetical protein LLF83_01465 [Methanobacterium sp.]|nr:hypothetical protein [Methanobacterium sp.]
MRKIATLFLLMITFGMVFAGAVSAQDIDATVNVTVNDTNGDPVDVTCPGNEVIVDVLVKNNGEEFNSPVVGLVIDPESGLQFDPNNAMMWDGSQWIINDPSNWLKEFFYWDSQTNQWCWDIQLITNLAPNQQVELLAPAIVTDYGSIKTDATLYQIGFVLRTIDEDSYTFESVPCHNCHGHHGETVPMQATGSPLALAALGLLGILGGAVYGKLR